MTRHKLPIKVISGVLAAALLLSPFAGGDVSAASSGELQQQIDALKEEQAALQEEMEQIEGQISQNVTQIQDMVEKKNQIDEQIFILHDQIQNTNDQIAALGVLIADKQEELLEAEARLAALNEKHKDRIRAMEEQGSISYWSILFRANSFADFLDRLNMIQEIAASDQRRLQELRDAAKVVEDARRELESQKTALEQTRQELEDTQLTLDEKRTEADGILQELLSKGAEYEQLLEQSEQAQDELMLELAQRESEYDDALYQEWLATSVPETVPPAQESGGDTPSEEPPSSAGWLTPVPYYTLTSPFGMRFHPLLNIWRMHNGVDMACNQGTPIYATRSGYVTVTAYQEDGAGNYVQLDHGDGYRSIYMHMTHYIVSPGQYVTQGQVIGYVGSTGLSEGPHLHFGISYNGTYVNPMEYL